MINLIATIVVLAVIFFAIVFGAIQATTGIWRVIIIILLIAPIVIYIICKYKNKKDEEAAEHYRAEQERKAKAKQLELEKRIKANHVNIAPSHFTFEEAKKVMIGSDHASSKAVYNHYRFFKAAFDCILENIPKTEIVPGEIKNTFQTLESNPVTRNKLLTKKTVLNSYKSFVSIDLETTGLNPEKHRIIELSAIKFINFDPVEHFHTYINPGKHIPKQASDINKITDDMVADAPFFSQILDQLQGFIKGFHLIAYNAPFDIEFLHCAGLDLNNHKSKVYDVLDIARKILNNNYDGIWECPDNYKLATVCRTRNIGSDSFHSAASDSLACALLFIDFVKEINDVENAYSLVDTAQQQRNIKPFYLKSYTGEKI